MINHSIMKGEEGIKEFPSRDKFNYSGDIQSVNYIKAEISSIEDKPGYPSYPKLEIYPEDEVGKGTGAVITPVLSKYHKEEHEKSKKWLYDIWIMNSYTKLTDFTINNPGKGYIKPRLRVVYYSNGEANTTYINLR